MSYARRTPNIRRTPHALSAAIVFALATACSTTTAETNGADEDHGADAHTHERGHAQAGDLTVSEAWMPEPANPEVGAIYLDVANAAEEDDALTEVRTTASGHAELHTTETDDSGSAQMVEMDEVPVPAGETVEFTSGGYHVMVLDITEPLAEGDEFTATLSFAGGSELELTVPVEPMTDSGDHEDHNAHDDH